MKSIKISAFLLAFVLGTGLAVAGDTGSKPLKWYGFEEGMALGSEQGKKVFIHFWADWCAYCHAMDRETFQNPSVVNMLNRNFVAVKVDTDRDKELSTLFRVRGLPDNWFFSESGDVLGHRPGYIPAETFMKILQNIDTGAEMPQ